MRSFFRLIYPHVKHRKCKAGVICQLSVEATVLTS
jgi:hypothetical protein